MKFSFCLVFSMTGPQQVAPFGEPVEASAVCLAEGRRSHRRRALGGVHCAWLLPAKTLLHRQP